MEFVQTWYVGPFEFFGGFDRTYSKLATGEHIITDGKLDSSNNVVEATYLSQLKAFLNKETNEETYWGSIDIALPHYEAKTIIVDIVGNTGGKLRIFPPRGPAAHI